MTPKRVLAFPDLEHAKAAVLNSLTSASGQRTYDHAIREFVAWHCSEPRLAFNRTVVLRYRMHLDDHSLLTELCARTFPIFKDEFSSPRRTVSLPRRPERCSTSCVAAAKSDDDRRDDHGLRRRRYDP